MSHAAHVANALLRLGALDPDDPDQNELRQELYGNPALWDEVSTCLDHVGFELVDVLGRVGVRVGRGVAVAPLVSARNNLDLNAGHIRVLVYLWLQLVYRQIQETLRDHASEPQGRGQTLLGFEDADAEPETTLPTAELYAEFSELSRSHTKGVLGALKRAGFVKESAGVLRAGPALYVFIDHERIEEAVVGMARKGAQDDP